MIPSLKLKGKMLILTSLSILCCTCQESPARGEYLQISYEDLVLEIFRDATPKSITESPFALKEGDVLIIGDINFIAWMDTLYYANQGGCGLLNKKGTHVVKIHTGEENKALQASLLKTPTFEFCVNSVCEKPYRNALPYAHYRLEGNDPDPWKNEYTLIRSRDWYKTKPPTFRLGDFLPTEYEQLFGSAPD